MGMFDTVVMAGPKDALRCAHGHEVRELQRRSLECAMLTYYVWDGIRSTGPSNENAATRATSCEGTAWSSRTIPAPCPQRRQARWWCTQTVGRRACQYS